MLLMKNYVYVLFFVLMSACSTTVSNIDGSIWFSEEKHDFGAIPFKKEASYSFGFSNIGKSPLIIQNVKTGCGCTVPEWTKKPIRPGEKGQLKIKYNASFPGKFNKRVEVFYNGPNSPAQVEIQGEVQYPKERDWSN